MTRVLFISLLFVLSAFTANAGETLGDVSFKVTEYNLGSFRQGIVRRVVFVFKNTGNAPVVIQDAKVACGCTAVTYSKKPVMPGKNGYITVWYNSNKAGTGTFNKSVDVYTNAKTSIVRLFISGETR